MYETDFLRIVILEDFTDFLITVTIEYILVPLLVLCYSKQLLMGPLVGRLAVPFIS